MRATTQPPTLRAGGSVLGSDDLRARFEGRVAALIPAYEEAEALPAVLGAMPRSVGGVPVEVLVVDDGSRDATAEVAERAGAVVAVQPANRGGGAALRTGYALLLAAGARVVVTLDADGQHLPSELERVAGPVLDGSADVVAGSRVLGAAEPGARARELGIVVFNRLISLLTRRRVTDASNAYRAIAAPCLAELDLRQDQFHASELLIEALTRGLRTIEVPVTVVRRTHGETKKPRTLRYGIGFAQAIVRTWLRATLSRRSGSRRSARTPVPPERAAAERLGA